MDVLCLNELFTKFNDVVIDFCKKNELVYDLFKFPTISSFSYNYNCELLKKKNLDLYLKAYECELSVIESNFI